MMQPYPTIQNYGYNPYLTSGWNQNNYMPVQTQPQMSGKYVANFNEINANDVAMDGKPSVFVKNDKSEIQIREWTPNGQILIKTYTPSNLTDNGISSNKVDNVSTDTQKSNFDVKFDVLEPIFERLEQLENKIDRLSRPIRTKKEANDE